MDQNGSVTARHDYLPFGEEVSGTAGRTTPGFGATDNVTEKFTGQVRDSETSQDFFNARYFTPALGRFNSVDPANAGASLFSSQSWNGYAYVSENPLANIDPSGRCDVLVNGVDQHPGWQTIDKFSQNMINVFPFDTSQILGSSKVGGAVDALMGNGTWAAYQGIQLALAETPANQQVNAYGISGGSSSLSGALSMLTPGELSRIGNVTYMIPGNFGTLSSGTGTTTLVTGNGLINALINWGTPGHPFDALGLNCGHDPACVIAQMNPPSAADACPVPATGVPSASSKIFFYGGGGGQPAPGSGGTWTYFPPTTGENGDSSTGGGWIWIPNPGRPRPPSIL